jgi:lysophospholipase L1-like esterase
MSFVMNANPNARRILFYGDSLVFGKIPGGTRFGSATRFTGIVQSELGVEYEIIEEGLRGRMIAEENIFFPNRNGLEQFGPIFGSHLPIDILVLFLGTNDINSEAQKSSEDIAKYFNEYERSIKWWCDHFSSSMPQVVLIAPPRVDEEYSYELFKDIFKDSKERSLVFPDLYHGIAETHGWHFLDSSIIISPSHVDGVHLDEENNKILGQAIARFLPSVLSSLNK